MDERDNKWSDFFKVGTPQCGIASGIVGALIALMLLFLGLWKTLFVALLFGLGYGFGAFTEKTEKIKAFINRIFPPKGE
ncbi:MAG: DUF2273 domain-containing protein [Clostridiales bacterium]|nr:DUF2273 domain-containing protein [Clostridiales bacterium]